MSDENSLKNQTAIVTGAARRIGRAVAVALAREGVNVVVHYLSSPEDAERTALEARAHGVQAWTLPADLADPAQAEALVPRARELAGALDILVNNASIFPKNRLADFTAEDLAANMQVNAFAPLVLARAFAILERPSRDNRPGPSIINLLDSRITDYDEEHAAYHLSKRMLFALTRMMALEFAPVVRVNAVAPGAVLAPEGESEPYLEVMKSTNPLRRFGDAEGVTSATLFLLRSDFVTGQVIYVDGGRHLKGNIYG